MVPALLKVPPPLAMMPVACWLTIVAPAALVNVVADPMKAPRPPKPLAVIDPALVIDPSVFPRDVMPCALLPETLIVPLLIRVLLSPFPNNPCAAAPVVVIVPLLLNRLPELMACMPDDLSPEVAITAALVRVLLPPEPPNECSAGASLPWVMIVPPVSFKSVLPVPVVKMPSEKVPAV